MIRTLARAPSLPRTQNDWRSLHRAPPRRDNRQGDESKSAELPRTGTGTRAIALACKTGPETDPVPALIINIYDNCRKG